MLVWIVAAVPIAVVALIGGWCWWIVHRGGCAAELSTNSKATTTARVDRAAGTAAVRSLIRGSPWCDGRGAQDGDGARSRTRFTWTLVQAPPLRVT